MKRVLAIIVIILLPLWALAEEQKAAQRGWLAVSIQDITEDIAKLLNYETGKGVLVADAFPDGPAAKAGIRTGDIIVAIDKSAVKTSREMVEKIGAKMPGDQITLTVWRDGKEDVKKTVLGTRPPENKTDKQQNANKDLFLSDPFFKNFFNVNQKKTADLNKGLQEYSLQHQVQPLGVFARNVKINSENKVVITEVIGGGPAEKASVAVRDIILEADKKQVRDVDHLSEIFSAGQSGKNILLLVERNNNKAFISVTPNIPVTTEPREQKFSAETKQTSSSKDLKPEERPAGASSFDIEELPANKNKRNESAYAIVIGIENYRQNLPKADFAANDARLVTEYLTKVMGYPEENVVTLLNDRALKSDFEKYFDKWLANNVEKNSTVFIYYSGHGAPNPKTGDAYLVPYDGDPAFIDQTGYSLKRLYASLGTLPAKEIIVALDSCFSGAGGRSVIAKGSRPLVMNLQVNAALSKNISVLSASSGEEVSSTYEEKRHGLFTYFLLKGIKTEDVLKKDGTLAVADLFNYLKPQVERIARKKYNNEQTPQLIGAKK